MIKETPDSTSSSLSPCDRSAWFWFAYGAFILAGLLLRWMFLDARPYHHDESLHGMYGRYFYDFPDFHYYRYDPMLHGPFLYNLLRIVYSTVGDSNWAARSVITLLGSAFLFLPYLFRRYYSRYALLALTGYVALSPSLVYWSRFIREDYPVVAMWFAMLAGAVLAPPRYKALLIIPAICLQISMKENAFVTFAILLGYLVFELFVATLRSTANTTFAASIGRHVRAHWPVVLLSTLLGVFFYVYLLNAGFRHPEGALDALYRKSISYWMEHHNMERIQGPFNFHLYMLGWYELPFFLAYFIHLICFYRYAARPFQVAGMGALAATVAGAFLLLPEDIRSQQPWKFFKLKDIYDYLGLCLLLVHPVIVTTQHLLRNERSLAFFGYFFTATLFTYSYLGEKVPWLSMYPLISGLAYLTLFFDDYLRRHPWSGFHRTAVPKILMQVGWVLVLLGALFLVEGNPKEEDPYHWTFIAFGVSFVLISAVAHHLSWLGHCNVRTLLFIVVAFFTLRASIQTNFVYAGHAREYISQVHTTPEFHKLIMDIRQEATTLIRGYAPTFFCEGTSTWPVTWYMRDIPEYKFSAKPEERASFKYIIQDWEEPGTKVPDGFIGTRLNLRGWWLPDFNQMTLKRFLNYSLNRTPWGPVGYTYAHLLVNTKK